MIGHLLTCMYIYTIFMLVLSLYSLFLSTLITGTSSQISGDEQAIFCMNGKPNVFNEAHCKLSTEENACMREGTDNEDTVAVVTLNADTMHAIKGHLYIGGELQGNGVPAVITGLTFGDSIPPCTMESVSRWIVVDDTVADNETCYNGLSIEPKTKDAFEHLLNYAVSNNDGGIRDVRMVSYSQSVSADDSLFRFLF